MSYQSIAGAYDALMKDACYEKRAAYLHRCLRAAQGPVRTVLDLGCGIGTIACLLAGYGYQVTATDASEDMLTVAAGKAAALQPGCAPLFVRQKVQRLRLPEPVDAAVSTLDSLNYLTRPADVRETFARVYAALRPGGLFLFDVNTPEKLARMDGQVWLDETEDVLCVWRTEFSARTEICTYWVDLFEKQAGALWRRSCESHRERAWTAEDLTRWLTEAGFARIRLCGDLRAGAPRADEDRWIFRCRKPLREG